MEDVLRHVNLIAMIICPKLDHHFKPLSVKFYNVFQ
jgi:hypothetical protein